MTRTSPVEVADKKRKRGQGGKIPIGIEEGEIPEPHAKEARAGKRQQKKLAHTGTSKDTSRDQSRKASI